MPLYTFICECGFSEEILTAIAQRDLVSVRCSNCNDLMKRVIDGAPVYHGEPYQMKAVLANGTKVRGHFGKSAPLIKKK